VLTEILRTGSQKLLAAALDVEIEEFLEKYADEKDRLCRRDCCCVAGVRC